MAVGGIHPDERHACLGHEAAVERLPAEPVLGSHKRECEEISVN